MVLRHMNDVCAINAAGALAQWERKCFCNARVVAVWRQDFAWECNRFLGDRIAENRTSPHDKPCDLPCDVDPVPCRYCGGRGPSLGVVKSVLGDFAVECDCTVRGPSGITPRHAIELWNKMQKGIGNG